MPSGSPLGYVWILSESGGERLLRSSHLAVGACPEVLALAYCISILVPVGTVRLAGRVDYHEFAYKLGET